MKQTKGRILARPASRRKDRTALVLWVIFFLMCAILAALYLLLKR